MLKLNYPKWVLRLNRLGNDFRLLTTLIFILGILNIIYKFDWADGGIKAAFNMWNPSWLLFGPLLYCAYRSLVNKPLSITFRNSLHLVPFMGFSLFYLIVALTTDMNNPWGSYAFTFYQNSYGIIILSLIPYSVHVLAKIWKSSTRNKPDADILLVTIAALYILIAILVSLMIIGWGIAKIDMGFDYRYFAYGLLVFINIAICWYWVVGDKKAIKAKFMELEDSLQLKSYKNSALADEQANEYKERIVNYFEDTRVYLEPSLSLDFLSKELGIPKHYFSQLFNVYLERSFHNFVADYRILYAIELLSDNQGRLKIESLAYSCGFNSKTSFNKYFKERTGFTPSEYLLQLERQSA
ncbi:AraC family transcriptional regulator [Pedobacter sp. KR3-3]|uniref:AraC family transcriptional regulator n=1 Tax=Pedobacter albus TaxID=3113905 RepID=A0ABU7I5W4_9SPHI|nr:AraC family transcriptional regulator [Pedobacter sp. KR3-3]MEE1944860.1 AraC family transcriptional regulator [Pedobacter sp. KR3-3]